MLHSDAWRYIDRTLRARRKDVLNALASVENYDDFRRFQGEALALERIINLDEELLELDRARQEKLDLEESSTPSEVEEQWQ